MLPTFCQLQINFKTVVWNFASLAQTGYLGANMFCFLTVYIFTVPRETQGEVVKGFHFNPRRQEDYQIPMEDMKKHKEGLHKLNGLNRGHTKPQFLFNGFIKSQVYS